MNKSESAEPPIPPSRKLKPSLNGNLPLDYYGPSDLVENALHNGFLSNIDDLNNIDMKTDRKDIKSDIVVNSDHLNDCTDEFIDPLSNIKPEIVIGENVEINGDLEFNKLLQLNGVFSGNLLVNNKKGNLRIGKSGKYIGDILNLDIIVIYGTVLGNINGDYVHLYNAIVNGNIICKSLSILGDKCNINGSINVCPVHEEIAHS